HIAVVPLLNLRAFCAATVAVGLVTVVANFMRFNNAIATTFAFDAWHRTDEARFDKITAAATAITVFGIPVVTNLAAFQYSVAAREARLTTGRTVIPWLDGAAIKEATI